MEKFTFDMLFDTIELLPTRYVVEGNLVKSILRSRRIKKDGTVRSESESEGAVIICSDNLHAIRTCCELNSMEHAG